LPINDTKNYIRRHPEISFIVYRIYDAVTWGSNPDEESEDEDVNEVVLPTPSRESISIVSDGLLNSCKKMFKLLPYAPSEDREDKQLELKSPYLFIYHSRSSLDECTSKLDTRDQKEWNLLIQYIIDTWSTEYKEVDGLIAKNEICNSFLHYLFKPKEHVVVRRAETQRGYMSTSWPKPTKLSHRALMKMVRMLGISFSESDREKGLSDEEQSRNRHNIWKLDAYCFKYNGNFLKTSEELVIIGPKRNPHTIFAISELDICPLALTNAETHALLKKRGEVFWKCRTRQYVAYVAPWEEDPATNVSPWTQPYISSN
jgi:hypothetical protein